MIPETRPTPWLAAVALVLALCAVPYGAVTAPFAVSLRVVVALLLGVAAILGLVGKGSRHVSWTLTALLGVCALGALQLVPWPAVVVGVISPEHAAYYSGAAELSGGAAGWFPLTVSRGLTTTALAQWLTVAAALMIGIAAGRCSRGHWIYVGIGLGAGFQALYGLAQWWTGSGTILGREVANDPDRVRGTFVNPDHFSLYLEMALVLIPPLAWWVWRELRRRFDLTPSVIAALPLVGLWGLFFASVVLSGSRSGLAAAAAGVLVQGGLIWWSSRDRGAVWIVSLGAVLGLATVVLSLGGRGFSRLLGTTSFQVTGDLRWTVLSSSLNMWRDFPLMGTGLGTFLVAYPPYQPAAAAGGVWRHAHNDWIEMLTTTGVVGLVLVVIGVSAAATGLVAVARNGVRSRHRAAAIAGLGAMVVAAVHELADFGLTMPATSVTLAVIVGVGLGCPVRSTRSRED